MWTASPHVRVYTAASDPLNYLWHHVPAEIAAVIIFLGALGALVINLQPIFGFFGKLLKLLVRPFGKPDAETRYRIHQRRLFARHVQSQLQLLATRENWHDERFADLEAEIEVEGRQRTMSWLRHSSSRTVILRREKSLSRALERSAEPLIVLEGDPGSGKSVALRHLAEHLADKARRSRELAKIPLYINLKEFRPDRRPVDSSSVYDFILASINRVNDRDVERFLEEEFDRGLRDGSWLLLLDSFDEIPDILSSTEADNAVEEYALAIYNFLFGMHGSRAIVASREFRGPKAFRVPRFQIVALSGRRQADLIRRSGLRPNGVGTVEGGLATADSEIRQAATNPMFLGLICEYVRSTDHFPESSHSVYESYLAQRFSRDEERVLKRYKVGVKLVRSLAEEIAFAMAAVPSLGLSPARQDLRSALINTDQISIARLDAVLDALEYTKLGRAAEDPDGSGRPSFTFAHRRFQEYFATCVVIRDPERVSVTGLLTDGRWRETAVTILQTQPATAVGPLLEEAERLLAPMKRQALADEESRAASGGYCWPPGAMHLLNVLSAGLGQTPDNIPAEFRADATSLLMSAWNKGRRYDRKWVISLALVANKPDTIWLLEQGFASGSVILGGAAYASVSRLADPSPELYRGVRKTLVGMAASGDLTQQKTALNAQIRRLPDPLPLIQTLRLLILGPKIDYGLGIIQILLCAALLLPTTVVEILLVMVGLAGYQLMLTSYTSYRIPGIHLVIDSDSATAVLSTYLARFAVAMLPMVGAFGAHPRNLILVIVAVISGAYFVSWPAAVGYVCRRRRGISVFLWPLIPPLALADLTYRAIAGIRKLSLATLSTVVFLLLSYVLFIWVMATYADPIIAGKAFQRYIGIAGIIGGTLMLISIIIPSGLYLYRRHNDMRLVDRFFSGEKLPVEHELLDTLGRLRTSRGVRSLMESALRVDLVAYPGVIRILSDIAAVAEAAAEDAKAGSQKKDGTAAPKKVSVLAREHVALAIQGVSPEFADWLKTSVENSQKARSKRRPDRLPFAVRNMPKPILDRISRSIEQIEMSRSSTLPQGLR